MTSMVRPSPSAEAMCGGDQLGADLVPGAQVERLRPQRGGQPLGAAVAAVPPARPGSSAGSWCRPPPWPRLGRTSAPGRPACGPPVVTHRPPHAAHEAGPLGVVRRCRRSPGRHCGTQTTPGSTRSKPSKSSVSSSARLRTINGLSGPLVDPFRLRRARPAVRPSSLAVGEHQVAAGRQRVAERRAGCSRVVVDPGRSAAPPPSARPTGCVEVEQPASPRGAARIACRRGAGPPGRRAALRVAGEDFLAVRHGDRVDVDVDHPGVRGGPLGDLVHVADGGDARADVEELAGCPRRRGSAPPGAGTPGWPAPSAARPAPLDRSPGGLPVGGEVVRAAEVVVVHAGRRWAGRGRCLRGPVRPLHPCPSCRRPPGDPRRADHPGILPLSCPGAKTVIAYASVPSPDATTP